MEQYSGPRGKGVGPYGVQPFKAMLKEQRKTQASVAEAVGRTTSNVTLLSNGWVNPPLTIAASVARVVGRPIEECFSPELLEATESEAAREARDRLARANAAAEEARRAVLAEAGQS